jgi:hypothetical protein
MRPVRRGFGGHFVEQDASAYVAASGDLPAGFDVEQELGGAALTAGADDVDVARQ